MQKKSETMDNKSAMPNKTETGFSKILLTAILTAIFTTITQYFLQKDKLSSEQKYWGKKYEIETIDKVNSQRLKILDEITQDLLQLEVKAKEIKVAAAASKYFQTPENAKELLNLAVQYHKDLNSYSAKAQMTSIYFDKNVDSIIPILGEALTLNYQNNLLRNSSEIKLPEFELNFETIDALTKTRISLAKAMFEEIIESYKLKND
jgi:hypothetical protein